CPRTKTDLDAIRNALFDTADLTVEIGAVKNYYIARVVDEKARGFAQHGGVVSALMALALEEGIIERAIVSEGGEDLIRRGIAVADPDAVRARGKSRFIVSPTVAEFNNLAKTEVAKIGVVATPCQALALAKMRMKPYPEDESGIDKLKLVVGLFCGWTLSWRAFVALLKKDAALEDVVGMDIPPGKGAVEVYTKNGTIVFKMAELDAVKREACLYCADTTSEFADISVGAARIGLPWEEQRTWNQLIVRTKRGQDLIELARAKGILEFRDAPEDALSELKAAAAAKKREAFAKLIEKSGSSDDLVYLNREDPVVCALL
ncbi:MAG: Coenzyme F420 hydrogenase/dehydrogenase, beta subunit C-terminal domain, partial [Smithellaceae bacterium]|nr:Coenzyme F420 hydrogenase/dehydrogenase, beta subunit C-terminal domain [Smithellaceae bacterium]